MLVKLVEWEDNQRGNRVLVQTLSYSSHEIQDSGVRRKAFVKRALQTITKACAQEEISAFRAHIPHLLTEELEYAAWAFVEHSRLSEEEFDERAATIKRIIGEIIGPFDDKNPPDCLSHLLNGHMTEVSFLYPTVCIEMTARVFCAEQLQYLARNDSAQARRRRLSLRRPFCKVDPDSDNHILLEKFVGGAINYLRLDELKETGQAVARILQDQWTYQRHIKKMVLMFSQLHQPAFRRRRGAAVRAIVDVDYADYKEVLEDLWAEANEEHQKYYADQLRIVHWMIENRVPTRPIATTQSTFLQDLRNTAESEALLVIHSVDESVQEENERRRALQAAAAQQIIAALLADIQDEPKPKRNTCQKTGKKKPRKGQRQTKTSNKGKSPIIKVVKRDISDDPLPGLKKYLEFASDELKQLKLRLPDDQDSYSGVIDAIESRLGLIDNLLESEETDAEVYVDLARSSDQFLTTVRPEISALEQRQAETDAFERDLRFAAQKEKIAYGRNNGGQLRRGARGSHMVGRFRQVSQQNAPERSQY